MAGEQPELLRDKALPFLYVQNRGGKCKDGHVRGELQGFGKAETSRSLDPSLEFTGRRECQPTLFVLQLSAALCWKYGHLGSRTLTLNLRAINSVCDKAAWGWLPYKGKFLVLRKVWYCPGKGELPKTAMDYRELSLSVSAPKTEPLRCFVFLCRCFKVSQEQFVVPFWPSPSSLSCW